MSRIIVKNLPKNTTENSLKELFCQRGGKITDVQLKYSKDGKFRQFSFIGFQSDSEAKIAVDYFNNTCINTNKITVELCSELGSSDIKSWSKHSVNSIISKNKLPIFNKDTSVDGKNKKSDTITIREKNKEKFNEHKNDPKFIEFLKVHSKSNEAWDNDLEINGENDDPVPSKEIENTVSVNDKEVEPEQDEEEENTDANNNNTTTEKLANLQISDREYLKSLQNKKIDPKSSITKPKERTIIDLHTIKIRDIPFKTSRQDILKFFKPIKPYSVRLPMKVHGFCYVGFKSEKDFKKALLKNRSFLKGKQVALLNFTEKNNQKTNDNELITNSKTEKWTKQNESIKSMEEISDSGKIFFRNLAYSIDENAIRTHFEPYGPISDIDLPIDSTSRQIKGFGTITFVMPEHAVRAYSELDGKTFHGRLLHLLPAKNMDQNGELSNDTGDNSTFKDKKLQNQKKTAGLSHNWNTLFLGTNAVANVLAKNYQTTKGHILDSEFGGTSAAVRLALGETEIILQMKKFLEENDVCLNVFDDLKSIKRSKTIILAKNLPAETTVSEMKQLFTKFGVILRIVMPPSSVTALIEFMEPQEAKRAFQKLAYTKFKNLPLYLEWAPENTFKNKCKNVPEKIEIVNSNRNNNEIGKINKSTNGNVDTNKNNSKGDSEKIDATAVTTSVEENIVDDSEPELDTTIFLRNLKFTTIESTVYEHFKHLGSIHMVQVARKRDTTSSERISLGYGFIQFKLKSIAEKAIKTMQFTVIDGHQVELKKSDRMLQQQNQNSSAAARKRANNLKQTGTKILIRNIPFQAKPSEIKDVFQAFGEIKSLRLPKKMVPGEEETHRGFGFIDFHTKTDAKQAFDAISQSTHLYGRRLVLEWAAVEDDIEDIRKRTADKYQKSETAQKRSKKSVFEVTANTND